MRDVENVLSRVLVTGGTSGIGSAVSAKLLEQGARVVLVGRDASRIEGLLDAWAGTAHFVPCDLRDLESVAELPAKASECMGGLDGVVHGAGRVIHVPLSEMSHEQVMEQMEVNLLAPIRLTQAAFPLLADGGGMVFLSSTLGERPIRTSSAYSSSKAGLDSFMRSVALEGAFRKIRANSVVLGMVNTPMIREKREQEGMEGEERLSAYGGLHLLGRLGEPEEVAELVVEVLRREWMTGARVVFDGGLLLNS